MNEKQVLLQILTLILFKVAKLEAQCNTCNDVNRMACVSDTTYQFCVNNELTGAINACPSGYVCSTTANSPIICQSTAAGAVATCSGCNQCNTNLIFACTGINTYALCLGQSTPSTTSVSCGGNLVCNLNSATICESSSTSTPSCSSAVTTTTTTASTPTNPTSVPTYAQNFCSVMQMNRRFQVPQEFDNTCKRYIICLRTTAGTWSGQVYTCAGSTFFDPLSLYCVATRPTNC